MNFTRNIVSIETTVKRSLEILNELDNLILFVVSMGKLVGTLTDGDIRRRVLKNYNLDSDLSTFMNPDFKYVKIGDSFNKNLEDFFCKGIYLIPLVDESMHIVKIIDLRTYKSFLPVDSVIMAGGRGIRLKPLTDNCPKPMLKVGGKPIIEFNIDRLASFGIHNVFLCINYLGEQIEDYFSDGKSKGLNIKYIKESQPLGTFGAISMIDNFQNENILICNSDLLTDIDYKMFFDAYKKSNADMAIASIPYNVNIPYAVLESIESDVISFKEKPTYTYFSNAGIYLVKKELFNLIPSNEFFNATDFIQLLLDSGKKVIKFPFYGYWLDIGRKEDFIKANLDIDQLKL